MEWIVKFVKIFKNREMRRAERYCKDEQEMKRCFDECVQSFERECRLLGTFMRHDYYSASGAVEDVTYAVYAMIKGANQE